MQYGDNGYDQAVDDFMTGDIHLIHNATLFQCIEKYGLVSLSDCSVLDVQTRRLEHSI